MIDYLRQNIGQIGDGLLFGLGVLAIYLGAVFTGALIRSLGGAGSMGLTIAGRYFQGWIYYLRGDDRNTINVTINMIVNGCLKFDTLVADRRIWYVWPNAYRVQMIRRAAKRTTVENPVLQFPAPSAAPRSLLGAHPPPLARAALFAGDDRQRAGERQDSAGAAGPGGRLQGRLTVR